MIDFAKKPLFLAPMAGFSDPPFREVVKKFGADITISEMISSNALVYESKKTLAMLNHSPLESPFIAQIAGADREVIKKAVLILNGLNYIDGIDFNCGCPVNKVVKQNAGSSLLENLELLKSLLSTIKEYNKKKFTSVKIRLGFNENKVCDIVKICEKSGADFISIHGRTKKQLYSGKADYKAIKDAKEIVKIPIIANGDINFKNASFVLSFSKCDGLMIGRASIGRPWIFKEIKQGFNADLTLKKEVILYHFNAMLKHYGKQGVSIFRKHLHEYSKNHAFSSTFRDEINHIDNENKMQEKIEEFFS
ncbi:tRNA-dihydrouridine synthase [Campylobacter sp. LR291e]|uniref:tRNA dihydrouridine synthase n=1 Tax=unclassified Campylobacter TaxID=2593542 RepID=UPI0012382363|nr:MULTISPECIES: tRNA-dihydrouridine synthase [unclassified Campylobacter]KAA6227733.1 tRNA-dihydrouridine synthase [Campylobacter sp. LR185c]KAA6231264.1 tRNA-dihydrouridine synthase [Campylobacter sp. LR291e]KAA6234154.1 tRNA-dihydrouridine synthase [Campylobacter sp. LR264d]KAA8603398.1 tRNA dihydrouridine synthase DusB [Campylobacter sp. LR185c]